MIISEGKKYLRASTPSAKPGPPSDVTSIALTFAVSNASYISTLKEAVSVPIPVTAPRVGV
ncbi:hypothetical protein D3C81_1071910 [compost metagenome]